jgi:hypothetical protein
MLGHSAGVKIMRMEIMKFTNVCCIATMCTATSYATIPLGPFTNLGNLAEIREKQIVVSETKDGVTTEHTISAIDLAEYTLDGVSRESLRELVRNSMLARCLIGCAGGNPDVYASSSEYVREMSSWFATSYFANRFMDDDNIAPDKKIKLVQVAKLMHDLLVDSGFNLVQSDSEQKKAICELKADHYSEMPETVELCTECAQKAQQWIYEFNVAYSDLIRQVLSYAPDRSGWRQRMCEPDFEQELVNGSFRAFRHLSKLYLRSLQEWPVQALQQSETVSGAKAVVRPCSQNDELERRMLGWLQGMYELNSRYWWLEHVDSMIDWLSTTIPYPAPDPAEQLIELITKTLREGLATPAAQCAMCLAKKVITIAQEKQDFPLEKICEAIKYMLGSEGDLTSVMAPIVAAHVTFHTRREDEGAINRAIMGMLINGPIYADIVLLTCCKDIISATRWICGLEHPTAIALIQHIRASETNHAEQRQQMNRDFVIGLYELLDTESAKIENAIRPTSHDRWQDSYKDNIM